MVAHEVKPKGCNLRPSGPPKRRKEELPPHCVRWIRGTRGRVSGTRIEEIHAPATRARDAEERKGAPQNPVRINPEKNGSRKWSRTRSPLRHVAAASCSKNRNPLKGAPRSYASGLSAQNF